MNGPLHCFGHHENCSSDFCTVAQQKQIRHITLAENNENEDDSRSTSDDSQGDITIEETINGK